MDDPNRVVVDSSSGFGCGIALLLLMLALSVLWYFDGYTLLEGIVSLLALAVIVFLFFHRRNLFFDPSHRKLVRSQRGFIWHDKEFDLDQCSVRVLTANDSGIFHTVSINAGSKELANKREGSDGYISTRRKAAEWASLLGIPVFDISFGDPLPRNPEELEVPIIHRTSTQALSAPPPNEAVPITHEDGMMVFDLGNRQKLYVAANALKITCDIFITTISRTVAFNDVMELDFNSGSYTLVILTKDRLIGIGGSLSPNSRTWLRHAVLYAMAQMGRG